MKTLILEFQISGHYPEYLKHVLNKISEDRKHEQFLIFINPKLKNQLSLFENRPISKSIHYFSKNEANAYSQLANTKQMANFFYKHILLLQAKYKFGHVLFLNLSLVIRKFKLLNPLTKLPFTFSGILMNSPYRLRQQNQNKWLVFKRELPIKLLVKNKNCTSICILNDKMGVEFYQQWSSKIEFIVDPVRIAPASKIEVYNFHHIDSNSITFLQIGKLGKYKGTLDIFNAIRNIDNQNLKKMHFLFIGKTNADIDAEIDKWNTSKLKNHTSIRNEFISDEDFTAYIQQSNVVLITNRNAENSSGIVNHCLANNKVVIAPGKGYYKEIFKAYKGVALYGDKRSLSDTIMYTFQNYTSLQDEADQFNSEKFISENTDIKFAETLLSNTY